MSFLKKIEAKASKISKYEITLTVVTPGTFKPFKTALLQSPGALDYLGEYEVAATFDPYIENMKVKKLKIEEKELKKLSFLVDEKA